MAPVADVTVVGAGPVGMTVAALIGTAGHRVHVLERRSGPSELPRAVHLDHHAARVLDAAGVMAALAPSTEAMDAYEWRSASGGVLLRLQPEGPVGWAGWPDSSMFHQPDLEAALAARLDGLATVTIERGTEVLSLDGLDGWVVAADGAGSTLRDAAGIAVTDAAPSADWLIVDVVPDHPRRWEPCNVQVCDPARPTTAVSGGPGRRRFEFMALPGEDPADLAGEAAAWRLLEPWGYTPSNCRIERHALYRFAARMVETWGKGRLLLAGDAAHQMPPFAGRGLGAGLRDAMNLGWKLDMVLRGSAAPGLLATYGSERAAPVRFETDFSTDLGAIICVADPEAAAARDRDMAAGHAATGPMPPPPEPPLGPGLLLDGDPAAGGLAPQGVVGGRRADEVHGRGWLLHGLDGDPVESLPPAAAAWWASIGGRGVDCSQLGEPYRGWLGSTGPVALVRPDFAVFGAGGDAPALVEALRSGLDSLAAASS